MPTLSRKAISALVGMTLVLHTTEEYLTFPAYLPPADRWPPLLPSPALLQNPQNLHVALIAATVLPLAVIVWTIARPRKGLVVSALFLECILLVNAGWHIYAAWVRGGCAPRVITAVLIDLPFGIYVLQRVVREQ